MTLLITLTNAGTDSGPFDLYSDANNYTTPFETNVLKSALVSGYTTSLAPVGTTSVRIQSEGACTNYIDRTVIMDVPFIQGTGFNNYVFCALPFNNGKTLFVGQFTTYNNVTTPSRIVVLNQDGSIDPNFSLNAGSGFSGGNPSRAYLHNNSVFIFGTFTGYNGSAANRLIKINLDGTIDTSFSSGSGFNNLIYAIAIRPDGRVIVGGSFTTYRGLTENRIVGLLANGDKDPSFVTGTGYNSNVVSMLLQDTGKVIIVGNSVVYNGSGIKYLHRLNLNGSYDNSFVQRTENTEDFFPGVDLIQTIGGNILVSGFKNNTTYNGAPTKGVVLLDENGNLNTQFSSNIGTGFFATSINGGAYNVAEYSDGRLLFTFSPGDTFNNNLEQGFIRLNADGTEDTSFVKGTGLTDSENYGGIVWMQANNKVYLAVSDSNFRYNGTLLNYLGRIREDGSLDI